MYGDKTIADFESACVSSFTSAALDVNTLGAEDGALHESECLNPPLDLEGYVFIRDDLDRSAVFDTLRYCSVGADRRYGWGRLCMSQEPQNLDKRPLFDEFAVTLETEVPTLRPAASTSCSLPAHTICDHKLDSQMQRGT